MDNLAKQNYEAEIAEKQADLSVLEARANYLEHSSDVSMPVLRVADLLGDTEEETSRVEEEAKTEKAENSVSLESALEILESTETQSIQLEEKSFDVSIVPMTYELDELTNNIPPIDSNAKSQAYRIADIITDEVHKFWTSKRKIRSNINEVNLRNAYSFVGYMITTSDSGTVLGDIKNYITYNEIVHIIVALSRQAKNAGLVDLTQYRKLKKEHNEILKNYASNLNKKADNRSIRHLNHVIEEMYQEMSKVY